MGLSQQQFETVIGYLRETISRCFSESDFVQADSIKIPIQLFINVNTLNDNMVTINFGAHPVFMLFNFDRAFICTGFKTTHDAITVEIDDDDSIVELVSNRIADIMSVI